MTTQEAVDTIELYIVGTGGAKEPISGDAALAALRELEAGLARVHRVGEMALAWYAAQDAWERGPHADMAEMARLYAAQDHALAHLRAACMVALMHRMESAEVREVTT